MIHLYLTSPYIKIHHLTIILVDTITMFLEINCYITINSCIYIGNKYYYIN